MKESRAIAEIPAKELDNLLCHFFIKVSFSQLEVYLETEIIVVDISVNLIIKNFPIFHLCSQFN